VIKRLAKIISIIVCCVLVLTLGAFGCLVGWVAHEPRNVPELTPYIEKALSSKDDGIETHIGETWIQYTNWKHPLDIHLKDIKVTRAGNIFTSFSEIALRLDLLSLPLGQILPSAITVSNPAINLFQNQDRSITFGFGEFDFSKPAVPGEDLKVEPPSMVPVSTLLAYISSPDSGLRKLRYLKILDARATIGSLRHGAIFSVTGMNLTAKRNWRGDLRIVTNGDMQYSDNHSAIGLEVLLGNYRPTLTVNVIFDKIVPSDLAILFSDEPTFKTLDAPLSGNISATLDQDGKLQSGAFNIDGGSGHIQSKLLPAPVDIDSLHAEGDISNDGSDINFKSVLVQMGKKTLSGIGNVLVKDKDVAIQGTIGLTNIVATETKKLWPESLAPLTRDWVVTNVTEGNVPEATVRLNIQFGDLQKPVLPREAVDASVTLKDATIRYLPEHPVVTNVQSVIHIDGLSLAADISSADYMKATKISGGHLLIDDLNADNPYIKLNFDVVSTAKDVVHLLRLPRLEHAKHLNLDPETAQGTGTAHGELGFYFFAPKDEKGKPLAEDGMTYTVTGDMKDIFVPDFMHKFDIKNGNGKLTVDTKQVTFNGDGNVNGAHASQANVVYKFVPEEGYDTFIDVTATAPVESLPRFGYPAFSFLKGSLGVKAKVKLGDELEDAEASINLTDAAVDVFGWNKPDKEPSTLDVKTEKRKGVVTIPSFKLVGKGVDAAGSAALNKDLSEFQKVAMDKVTIGNTNLNHVDYEMADGKLVLDISGKSADLTSWWENDDDDSNFSFEKFPAVDFKADVERLILSKRGAIANLKGTMSCSKRLCETANVSGTVGDNKEFNFRILRNPKGKRQVSLRSLDAGAFLKAFGAYPNIEGGELSLSGNYDDSAASSVLKGRFIIENYTVKKAPVLAKILSLASFTGVLDLMQGNGISFSKLLAPFTLQNDVVRLSKVKAYGGSIGITANGTVTFPKQALDIDGTVVPAYALNSIVGKIPLVGAILTGGDGGGVFAFNYSVKGSNKDPEVSVNPLSILTPGFLRGIFDSGDNEEKSEE
jgi:hypothetical protein